MRLRFLLTVLSMLMLGSVAHAQQIPPGGISPAVQSPEPFEILSVEVQGVENEGTRTYVTQSSGLAVGDTVYVPGDPSIADAIRNVFNLGLFSDVRVEELGREGGGIHLGILVREEPRLAEYSIEGVRGRRRSEERRVGKECRWGGSQ